MASRTSPLTSSRKGNTASNPPESSPEPTPDEKAASIINSVPQSNLFTKTGGVILGTGLTAAAISSELYVRRALP